MKVLTSKVIWGFLLIAGGILFLLENFEVIPESPALWSILFGVFGLYFLLVFIVDRSQWWTAFPAFTLLGVAGVIGIVEMTDFSDDWGGFLILSMIGLGFIAAYLRTMQHWWPIIPGGVMLTLAGVVYVSTVVGYGSTLIAPTLFGGLGLTFLVLTIVPSKANRAGWAIWPALGLFGFTLLISFSEVKVANFVTPFILIIIGLALLLRGFRKTED